MTKNNVSQLHPVCDNSGGDDGENLIGKVLDSCTEIDKQDLLRCCIDSDESGNSQQQFVLGSLDRDGYGITQSDELAITWFMRAAKQGNVDAFADLSACHFVGRGVEKSIKQAIIWMEKAAAATDDPRYSVVVAFAHLLGDQFFDWFGEASKKTIYKLETPDMGQINNILSACGALSVDLDESFLAVGLAGAEIDPVLSLTKLSITKLSLLSPTIFNSKALLLPDFSHELAERASRYVAMAGTEDFVSPGVQVREIAKWLTRAVLNGEEHVKPLLIWFKENWLGNDTANNSCPHIDDNTIDEPVWNEVLAEVTSERREVYKTVLNAVIERLSSDARNGVQMAERVLAHNYFNRVFIRGGASNSRYKWELTKQETVALYLPNAKTEVDAFIAMKNWAKAQANPAILKRHWDAIKMAQAGLLDSSPLIASEWFDDNRNKLSDRGRRALDLLLDRQEKRMTGNSSLEPSCKTHFSNIILAIKCKEPSLLADLVLQDSNPRQSLVKEIINQVKKPNFGAENGIDLVREELLQIEAEQNTVDTCHVKHLRFCSSNSLLASVVLACTEKDPGKRFVGLSKAQERRDIAATYLLSKDITRPGEDRCALLKSVINAVDVFNSHMGRGLYSDNNVKFPDYLKDMYEALQTHANADLRLLQEEKLTRKEKEKREAEENMMALFAHKFRGPVDSILFNTTHLHDERIYVDAAHTMNGLLDIFSVVSTAPEKLASSLKDDIGGNGSPASVLLHSLKLALVQLLSTRNRLRLSPHYLAYAKRQGQAPAELRQTEWMREKRWVDKEIELQTQWEQEIGTMTIGKDIRDIEAWMASHLLPIRVEGFSESTARFAEYGPRASLLTVIFTEVLVNAIKHAAPTAILPLVASWSELSEEVSFTFANPSTRDSRDREKSKGSGKGHKFLKLIAENIGGSFSADITNDRSWVSMKIPDNLMTGDVL